MIAPDNDVIKAREQLRTTDTNVNYLEQQITSLRAELEKAKKDGERLVEALGRIIEYWNGDSASAVDAMETCIYIAEEELLSNSIYNAMKGNS